MPTGNTGRRNRRKAPDAAGNAAKAAQTGERHYQLPAGVALSAAAADPKQKAYEMSRWAWRDGLARHCTIHMDQLSFIKVSV